MRRSRGILPCRAVVLALYSAVAALSVAPVSVVRAEVWEPFPAATTTPANGATIAASEHPVPWTVHTVSGMDQIAVELRSASASTERGYDYFILRETTSGVYEGVSHDGDEGDEGDSVDVPWWNDTPGTYEWSMQANLVSEGSLHFYRSPVFVLTVQAAPPSTPLAPTATKESAPRAPAVTHGLRCGRGFTPARIDGRLECLRAGELCAWRYRRQYPRYHYACVRRGRYFRLERTR